MLISTQIAAIVSGTFTFSTFKNTSPRPQTDEDLSRLLIHPPDPSLRCQSLGNLGSCQENEVSILVDKKNSRAALDGIVPICDPHHRLSTSLVEPNTKISIARIARGEKSHAKTVVLGDEKVAMGNGLVYGYGVCGRGKYDTQDSKQNKEKQLFQKKKKKKKRSSFSAMMIFS
ncbi:hypothetical protein GH714_019186 [Hevea brasiliensis]|uniref:Uncharacterized protein n=1 Tax=Hevea brasiliensis TaxID=3981 RepID=A0A6A6LQ42_HEVBR|nr:hypothetical protein GH714_019186 [Hevea brasiliensis]